MMDMSPMLLIDEDGNITKLGPFESAMLRFRRILPEDLKGPFDSVFRDDGRPFEDRMAGTVAAHTASVLFGADMVRAHDTFEAVQAARVADAIKQFRK